MTPEISEFSYGFSLTNQLVSWSKLRAAPIFPSLLEEGKANGGYDVRLDFPGVPVYLQFKRGYPMVMRSAQEIRGGKTSLTVPFHRFHIADSGVSNQHAMLLELESAGAKVLYAAPRFDSFSQLNAAWLGNTVAENSIFVKPSDIGPLDDGSHHVAYDNRVSYICSEPRRIGSLHARDLYEELVVGVNSQKAALADSLPKYERQLVEANERAGHKIGEEFADAGLIAQLRLPSLSADLQAPSTPPLDVPRRSPRKLDGSNEILRRIADRALRQFNAQLFIVQDEEAIDSGNEEGG